MQTVARSLGVTFFLLISFVSTGNSQVIVAHRGASYDAPENTQSAFRLAWDQHADGIEGDFYVTKDQQIVCIHDANTKRTAGVKREVAESTLAELRTLEYGAWKDPRFKGEPIPTFAEVMAIVPAGKLFVIELKTGPEIVPLLQAEVQRLKPVLSELLIIAFNADTVLACKQQLPEIRVHWLTGYKQNKETGHWTPTVEQVAQKLKDSRADGLGTQGNRDIVNAPFIEALRHSGMKEFHVWTIDVPDDARYFKTLGAVGITTNRPQFLRDALSK